MIGDGGPSVKRWVGQYLTTDEKTGFLAWVGGSWAGDCLLCLGTVRAGRVCENCERFLAYPGDRCRVCAIPVGSGAICGNCLQAPPIFDDIVTAFDYRFPVDRLVHRFKFGSDLVVGAYLGDALAHAVARAPRPDLLVVTPSAPARLRERGFDAAGVLARRLRARLRLPLETGALRKTRETPPQTSLAAAERRGNLEGAFVARGPLAGRHVAIVDDVMTTGSTLAALAKALKGAGAGRVSGWVVARTPEPGEDG